MCWNQVDSWLVSVSVPVTLSIVWPFSTVSARLSRLYVDGIDWEPFPVPYRELLSIAEQVITSVSPWRGLSGTPACAFDSFSDAWIEIFRMFCPYGFNVGHRSCMEFHIHFINIVIVAFSLVGFVGVHIYPLDSVRSVVETWRPRHYLTDIILFSLATMFVVLNERWFSLGI